MATAAVAISWLFGLTASTIRAVGGPAPRDRGVEASSRIRCGRSVLHEARHTCASVFIAAGANAKAIQAIMGPATIGRRSTPTGTDAAALDEAAAAAGRIPRERLCA